MVDYELFVPADVDLSRVAPLLEACCTAEGLRVGMKGSLAQYPGCVHWHLKKGEEPGTLELTLWEGAHRIWFSVHSGRKGDWIHDTMLRLCETIESLLQSRT